MGLFQIYAVVAIAVWIAVRWYQKRRHRSIKHLQGPSSTWLLGQLLRRSGNLPCAVIYRFLLGNELDIWWQDQLGETDFKWMAEYGNAWRVGGCFGVRTNCLHTLKLTLILWMIGRKMSLSSQTQRHCSTYSVDTTTQNVRTLGRPSVF